MKRKTLVVLSLLVCLIVVGVGQVGAAPIVLRFGGIQSVTDTTTRAMMRMAEQVEKESDGRLKIEVYPASQLGDAVSQIEGVMMGSLDMFCDAGEWCSQFVKDWNVMALTFVFDDEAHLRNFLGGPVNGAIEEQLRAERGVRVVANNWIRAPRVITSRKPILKLEDLQGLKMRVPEIKMYLESWQALGTKPTMVAWSEVYLALRQGIVEAAEGPLDTMYTMKFYEVGPHITLTYHLMSNMNVLINDRKFKSLPADLQEILIKAANDAGDWFSATVREMSVEYVEKMKEGGAQFYEVDIAPFKAKMPALAAKMEEEGIWSKGLYEQVQALR